MPGVVHHPVSLSSVSGTVMCKRQGWEGPWVRRLHADRPEESPWVC
jgi:hypothetical protein